MPKTANPLISIVDNDESVREATASLLRSSGYRTASFSSAKEFLDSRHQEMAACLVLDVYMPAMTGPELQQHLIDRDIRIPIIFVTAHPYPEIRKEALRLGAVEFLAKPFHEEALLVAIRSALGATD